MRKIADCVVVLTGASSGICRATALRIARQKGTVVLGSRQEKAIRELAAECERRGGKALAIPTDVTDEGQVLELARRAAETFGRIDAWINGAAVTLLSRFEEAPPAFFRRVMETNFFGYVHGARAVLPYFRKQKQGVLINIASVLGKIGSPYASAYVASKFAVTGFTESLRMELRDAPGIHVCTVLPATIDTPLFQHAANFTGRALRAIPPVYSAEQAAAVIVGCILHPRREVTVGNVNRMLAMRRLPPRIGERLIARKIDRTHFQKRAERPSGGNLFEPMPGMNSVSGGWADPSSAQRARWLGAALLGLFGVSALLLLTREKR